MEARSKWLWTVTIANAVVACFLIFVVFNILSLATMVGGAIPDSGWLQRRRLLGRP